MAVEVALYPTGLNPAAPTGGDKLYEADDVFRLLKTVLVNTFPNISGPITLTPAQLNALLRAPLVPSAETAFAFPSIATRSGKLFAFDGSGNPDVTRTLTAFDADVTNTAAAQTAAATSATNAANSASASAGYATTAQGYRNDALGYRDTANLWATSLSLVDGTYYGARKYSIDASNSAATATTQANAAAASAAIAGATLTGTSATSLPVTPGSKTLTTNTGKAWAVGSYLNLARTSAPTTTSMRGAVTAYDPTTGSLTVLIDDTTGSGTYTDWTITVAGMKGAGASLPVIPISTNTVGTAGNHYVLTAACQLTLPAPNSGDVIRFSNASGLTTPTVDFGTSKFHGQTGPGVLTLDSLTADATIQGAGATYGWV